MDVQGEQVLNRDLAARTHAEPVGRSAGASLRTVGSVLAEHGVLLPRDADRLGADVSRQQSLTVLPAARGAAVHPAARPHSALVGLRTRCHQRAFSGDPAGALAAVVRIDLRGVRRGEMRLGRGGDSLSDDVSADGDHASGREASSCSSSWCSFLLGPPSGVRPLRSPGVSAAAIGSNGATWESRMRSRPSSWCRCFLWVCPRLFGRRPQGLSPRRVLEATVLGACTVALGIFVFDQTPAGPDSSRALLYTPIPLLIWSVLRFGLAGISVSMSILTFQAIWGTMRGHGPFLAQSPTENALALQLFLLVTATPLMLLAVVIEEERRSKEALRESANLMGLAAGAGNLAMWVWDVSRDDLWMSEQGRSLFGFTPDARLDFAATVERVHPDDRLAREGAIMQARRDARRIRHRVSRAARGWHRPLDSGARSVCGAGGRLRPKALRHFHGCDGSQTGRGPGRARAVSARACGSRGHPRRAQRDPDA